MSRDSAERRAWAIRLLALPLQAALSVDRLVNRSSPPTEQAPRLTYLATGDRRLRRVSEAHIGVRATRPSSLPDQAR